MSQKQLIWKEIAKKLDKKENEVKKRWKSIRSTASRSKYKKVNKKYQKTKWSMCSLWDKLSFYTEVSEVSEKEVSPSNNKDNYTSENTYTTINRKTNVCLFPTQLDLNNEIEHFFKIVKRDVEKLPKFGIVEIKFEIKILLNKLIEKYSLLQYDPPLIDDFQDASCTLENSKNSDINFSNRSNINTNFVNLSNQLSSCNLQSIQKNESENYIFLSLDQNENARASLIQDNIYSTHNRMENILLFPVELDLDDEIEMFFKNIIENAKKLPRRGIIELKWEVKMLLHRLKDKFSYLQYDTLLINNFQDKCKYSREKITNDSSFHGKTDLFEQLDYFPQQSVQKDEYENDTLLSFNRNETELASYTQDNTCTKQNRIASDIKQSFSRENDCLYLTRIDLDDEIEMYFKNIIKNTKKLPKRGIIEMKQKVKILLRRLQDKYSKFKFDNLQINDF
ncbi:uncharacterized protein LOC126893525 isoform X2 [Daktulosphaira vitifoliae]|nr:uncharacterized protein LOC126893525 isoform X2 [Daktulosphaira vitifoliae]